MEEYVKNVKQFAVGQGLIQERPAGKLPPPPPQLDRILEEKVNHLSIQKQPVVVRPLPQFITAKPFVKSAAAPAAAQPYVDPDFSDLPPPPPDMLMDLPPPPPPEVMEPTACETIKTKDPVREFFDFLDEQDGKKLPGRIKSPFLHGQQPQQPAGTFNATAKPFAPSPGSSPNMNCLRPASSLSSSGNPSSRGSSPGSSSSGGPPKDGTFQSRRVLTTDLDSPEASSRPAAPQQNYINNNNNGGQAAQNNNNPRPPFNAATPSGAAVQTIPRHQQETVIQEPDQEWTCRKCVQPIEAGTVAIFAERAGSGKCWHPQCFTCSICNVNKSIFSIPLDII